MGNKMCVCGAEEPNKEANNMELRMPMIPPDDAISNEEAKKKRDLDISNSANEDITFKNKNRNDYYLAHYKQSLNNPISNSNKDALITPKFASENQSKKSKIHFETPLFKYKPSLTQQYLERWCKVTNDFFEYYATNTGTKEYIGNPIVKIPIVCIDSIKRVYVDFNPKYHEDM